MDQSSRKGPSLGLFVAAAAFMMVIVGVLCSATSLPSGEGWLTRLLIGAGIGAVSGIGMVIKMDNEEKDRRALEEKKEVRNKEILAELEKNALLDNKKVTMATPTEITVGLSYDQIVQLLGQPRDGGVSGADIMGTGKSDPRVSDVFLSFENRPDLDYSIRFSRGKVVSIKTYPKR